mgnify:CR=1 FL=1
MADAVDDCGTEGRLCVSALRLDEDEGDGEGEGVVSPEKVPVTPGQKAIGVN